MQATVKFRGASFPAGRGLAHMLMAHVREDAERQNVWDLVSAKLSPLDGRELTVNEMAEITDWLDETIYADA